MGENILLKRIIEKKHVVFAQHFDDWTDAVRASYGPLLEDKTVEEHYVQQVIDSIKKLGPYIVIAPDVAIPHTSMDASGVHTTDICLMLVKEPVHFTPGNDENDARVFFSLAAVNPDEHLENMQQLADLLMIAGFVEALPDCGTMEALKAVADKYSLTAQLDHI